MSRYENEKNMKNIWGVMSLKSQVVLIKSLISDGYYAEANNALDDIVAEYETVEETLDEQNRTDEDREI
jgi:hypothetical protein